MIRIVASAASTTAQRQSAKCPVRLAAMNSHKVNQIATMPNRSAARWRGTASNTAIPSASANWPASDAFSSPCT
jgi:hypothetical protein